MQNRSKQLLIITICVLLSTPFPTPALAQETRAEVYAKEQSEKAAALRPYEPSDAERTFLAVKRMFLDTPDGFYPLFGSIYSGGGLAMGGGYRKYYADRTFLDAKGLWSVRNYKFAEVSTHSPGHVQRRVDLTGHVGFRDAPQVAYYGTSASPGNRANFHLTQTYVGGGVRARPIDWIVLGAGAAYEVYDLGEGRGNDPSIEELYTLSTAPGLGASPKYLHTKTSAGIDWRPAAGYARRGGLYEVRYDNYIDRDDVLGFDLLEAEAVQHIPILRENWVISMRGLLNTTIGEETPPFFLLPSLGGGTTLRGYPSWRFRDRHSLLFQGEFRWIPIRAGVHEGSYRSDHQDAYRRT